MGVVFSSIIQNVMILAWKSQNI